jgi:hypothetical protein
MPIMKKHIEFWDAPTTSWCALQMGIVTKSMQWSLMTIQIKNIAFG